MSHLREYNEQKAQLLEALRTLAERADAMGMVTLARDVRSTRIPKLEEEKFNLVVLGEFNHGKSTFVNALLGADVLPTGITPTTATINHVVWAPEPRAEAVMQDDSRVPIAPGQLQDWVTVGGERVSQVRHVEVGHPARLLEDNVVLVDTPGVNDMNEQRAEITYGYVPRADAVVFLLDASQALKESERSFLASRVLERSKDRMIFVVGKMDLLTDDERAEVVAYVKQHLLPLVAEPPVFAVSARDHLAGAIDRSGMTPLLSHLESTLTRDRGRILLDNAADDALRSLAYLQQNVALKEQTLKLPLAELETRVGKVRGQLDATQATLSELHDTIRSQGEAIKAQIRLDLGRFAETFVRVLPPQIDAADPGDVKRYMALFIQDKFKEWAETEGERVAGQLEKLAEEVITVTNENARQATSALASRLGPSDGKLDLEIDTFKYDVSVYAIGALGTTVFLFVNSLVGGLLTLAAPILAVVLSSKMSAEIKDHAKEKGPDAIKRAATAIGPHFTGMVDDFTGRLQDFVSSAGDRLYKGISEILDRAIAERREHGDAIEPMTKEAAKKRQELTEQRAAVEALRQSLWAAPVTAAAPLEGESPEETPPAQES